MLVHNSLKPGRKMLPGFFAILIALCFMLLSTLTVFADTVRVSDPVEVLNVTQLTTEGSKLPYPLDIYTTNSFSGTASDFVQKTISVHLTSTRLIVIAMDTTHRFLAVVGGSSVPLSSTDYTSAGTAFKGNINGNHFTDATIAAIQSLEKALGVGATSKSSSGGSPLTIIIIIAIVVAIIVISAVYRLIRRLFGFGPPPNRPPGPNNQQPRYQDGRDNFGGGAVGDF